MAVRSWLEDGRAQPFTPDRDERVRLLAEAAGEVCARKGCDSACLARPDALILISAHPFSKNVKGLASAQLNLALEVHLTGPMRTAPTHAHLLGLSLPCTSLYTQLLSCMLT